MIISQLKVWTSWKAHKNLCNLPHALYIYLVNKKKHEEDFFQILCASQKVRTLLKIGPGFEGM